MNAPPPPLAPSARFALGAICAAVIGIFCLCAHPGMMDVLGGSGAHSYYNLLVRGFQDGRLSLDQDVPPGLAALENPYDPDANAPYRVPPTLADDLSYYRGKFYLYFGVTPALLLFWPWAALTGHYLPHRDAVLFFCSVGFLAGAGLVLALWRRYFAGVATAVAAAGILAVGLAASVPILLQRTEVYEVAISCSYAFTLLTLVAIWLALHRPDQGGRWLAAASLALGLAMGARPPALGCSLVLLVPLAAAWRTHDRRRDLPRLVAAAALPIILCGLGLLWYNQRRFGNPLEFGQNYQISGTRQDTARHFSLGYFWFDFRLYFLEWMPWRQGFPFLGKIVPPPLPPGAGIVEQPFPPFGILANIPVVWLALAAPLAAAGGGAEDRRPLRWFLAAIALFFVIPAAVICQFFGTCSRYELEFLPALVLLAVAGIFGLERSGSAHPGLRRAARALWIVLLAYSVGFNLLASCKRYALEHGYFGHSLTNLGRLPEAVVQLQAATRMDPGSGDAHEDLGVALARSGQLAAAMEEFRRTAKVEPGRADAHDNLGNCLVQLARYAEAIAEFREALRLRPDSAATHFNLAVAYLRAGQPAEANAEYREAVRLNPRLGPRAP
jgi:tetratricopeptide (TPR) repeat protein